MSSINRSISPLECLQGVDSKDFGNCLGENSADPVRAHLARLPIEALSLLKTFQLVTARSAVARLVMVPAREDALLAALPFGLYLSREYQLEVRV
jgi:hypothetical protein